MTEPRSVRVEQALRIVPELEALAVLRELLISNSRHDESSRWASSAPYLTVGKRYLDLEEIRRQVPQLLTQVTGHLRSLYESVLEALESQARADIGGAVRALLAAGELEWSVDRFEQARVWYVLALELAQGLRERRLQVEALRRLGQLSGTLGQYGAGADYYRQSLEVAEAELDDEGAVIACQGLGNMALARGAWTEARSWYSRGLKHARKAGQELRAAQLHHNLSIVSRREGALSDAAEQLARAREFFQRLGATEELARALNSQGLLDRELGRHTEALDNYRRALEQAEQARGSRWIELSIRINLSELHIELGRLLEAEEEIRAAEEIAIAHNLTPFLAQIYTAMGKLRGRQGDETGFVFFEKALELCQDPGGSPLVEGQVHYEYGLFRQKLNEPDEAGVHLKRAAEIFRSLGELPELTRVRTELARLARP